MMHALSPSPADSTADARDADGAAARDALEQLAAALGSHDFATTLVTRQGRTPYLSVVSRYAKLGEDIYADAGWFWWSLAERLATTDDVPTATAKITTVLRTTPTPPVANLPALRRTQLSHSETTR
jgi:hypothetical protein